MPALIACPNTKCDFPGPMGFSNPSPWGTHFYHPNCPGAWLLDEKWYDTEAESWKVYKKDNPRLEEEWVAAFDAQILRKDHAEYERLIEVWRLLHV